MDLNWLECVRLPLRHLLTQIAPLLMINCWLISILHPCWMYVLYSHFWFIENSCNFNGQSHDDDFSLTYNYHYFWIFAVENLSFCKIYNLMLLIKAVRVLKVLVKLCVIMKFEISWLNECKRCCKLKCCLSNISYKFWSYLDNYKDLYERASV